MPSFFSFFLKGFLMGSADIVPGVSGGTMALITGIYGRLIRAISSINIQKLKMLVGFRFREFFEAVDFRFLLPLFAGILCAILLMSRILHFLLSEYPTQTWAVFFGFVLSSAIGLFFSIPRKTFSIYAALFFGVVFGYLVVSLSPSSGSDSWIFLFFSGVLAICAMILPGISGSYILVILGNYHQVLELIRSPFVPENLLKLGVFAAGALIGLLGFSGLLNRAIKSFEFLILAAMTGIMFGTLKKMWPWKEVTQVLQISETKTFHVERSIIPDISGASFFPTLALLIVGFFIGYILIHTGEKASLSNYPSKKS